MEDEKKGDAASSNKNLEDERPTDLQKKIEKKITEDEQSLGGEGLSVELSKDRTRMSEHRTRMSEHRTGLSEHRTDLSQERTGMSDKRTKMSYERTALSYERTLMSWIRTATSLISFGFSIYKIFEEIQKTKSGPHLFTPRMVGLVMIAFGFVGLLFAEIQHVVAYRRLKKDYPELQRSLSSILGALILLFGLVLFFVALFRQ